MKTLILCSKHSLESHSAELVANQTRGTIRYIREDFNTQELSDYDRIILMYQHPLNPLNTDFINFCNSNPFLTEDSIIIVNIPLMYVNNLDSKSFLGQVTKLSDILKSNCKWSGSKNTSILINEFVDNQTQMEYAKKLGFVARKSIDEGIKDESHLFIMFSHISETYGNMTMLKANCSIIAGAFAIPLGVLIFYLGIVLYNTPPAFGVSLAMIGGGPILAYIGIKNRRYQQWLKN